MVTILERVDKMEEYLNKPMKDEEEIRKLQNRIEKIEEIIEKMGFYIP